MVETAVSMYGETNFLISNAGVLLMKSVEKNTTGANFDSIFNIKVNGPHFLVQKAVPHMTLGSRVVLLSTAPNFASTVSAPYPVYCTTKGVINQMVQTMSRALASKGIGVNAVVSRPTETDLFLKGKRDEFLNMIANWNAYNRIGRPDEVADAIVLLSGHAAAWVNGQSIKGNGGQA